MEDGGRRTEDGGGWRATDGTTSRVDGKQQNQTWRRWFSRSLVITWRYITLCHVTVEGCGEACVLCITLDRGWEGYFKGTVHTKIHYTDEHRSINLLREKVSRKRVIFSGKRRCCCFVPSDSINCNPANNPHFTECVDDVTSALFL